MTKENDKPAALPVPVAASAWLIRLGKNFRIDGFIVSFAGDSAALDNIREGDALVLVKESVGGLAAVAFGRLYRVRLGLGNGMLYLDGLLALEPVQAVADLGVAVSDVMSEILRVDWTAFETALKTATGRNFSAIPVIEGKTSQEQAYIRELLQLAVIDDLLGPACGPHEEIIGMSVRDRYLVGKLSPRTNEVGECIEGLRGPSVPDSVVTEGKAPADLKPFEETGEGKDKGARRTLPGEEFTTATGTTDPEGDDAREVDASKNQSFVPSSLGFTVCVDGAVESLELEVRWGRYIRTTSEEQVSEEGKLLRAWKRVPAGGKITIALKPGPIKPVNPDAECSHVYIQGTVRPPLRSGERLVTVFLVNDQLKPDQNQDEAWVFQPELILRHSKGEAIFRRRPVIGEEADDAERAALEMIYRNRVEFAVGHGVAVHVETTPDAPDRAVSVCTRVMPEYEVPITEAPGSDAQDRPAMRRMVDDGLLDMTRLAEMERTALLASLRILTDDYGTWISEQNARVGKEVAGYDSTANQALENCKIILERLREGILVLEKDDKALAAFRFANKSMAAQRVRSIYALERRRGEKVELADFDKAKNRSWRPFQLAFILLSIPALTDPLHRDRTRPVDAIADLLWFPTGGGKTEAYLGVAAFTMAIRRLQGELGDLDASRGLSVIMRYTLRLLTVQQFQRATTLICAMEMIRRVDEKTWGVTPFTIGLWVGQRVTPNNTEDSHEAIQAERTGRRPTSSTPAQLSNCPWCGANIEPGQHIVVRRFGQDIGRTFIYCGDNLGQCDFSRAKSKDLGLPVLVVDDEIYRWPPSMLIATVDKFAMMAWRGEIRNLFGRADKECPRHGLLWPGAECNGKHQKKGDLPYGDAITIRPIRPPDLIIQDELHLISGPLGTMVALYETAVDELSTWNLDGKAIRPKVIASTATVRKAGDQVNNIFLRRVSVFPQHGLDIGDDFFSIQRPIASKPGRRYLGICSPGSARPAVLIRLYTALLTAAQSLFERFGPAADPWMTVVGYFNSLRELGGMKRLAEDDVQTRSFRVLMSQVARPGLSQRSVKIVDELTSRVSNKDIPRKLDQLEIMFKGSIDPATGRFRQVWGKGEDKAIDVILATNMLGVGVDVKRLGLMAVNGQPKSTAEYIQATSRIGRFYPGIVFTVLTWSRPRDLSHFETFEHYHATFYKHVEAQSVTPFSPRALDRGLTGTMVSCLRLGNENYNSNLGAGGMNSVSKTEVGGLKKVISERGGRVTGATGVARLAEGMVSERCDEWVKEATRGGRRLGYEAGKKRREGEDDIAALLKRPGLLPWDRFTVPLSLREVEAGVRLIMNSDNLPSGPAWKAKPQEKKQAGGAK